MNPSASAASEPAATDPIATPIVIVGAGLAGLTVGLHLADQHPVVLLTKRAFGEAATAWAQGGIVGVLGDDDSVELHVRDTQDAGAGLVDEHAARFIAEHSAEAIEWLVAQGVPFTTDPEGPLGLHLTQEGGHAVRRGQGRHSAHPQTKPSDVAAMQPRTHRHGSHPDPERAP